MRAPFADAVDAVRRPEYTGENRCIPCTGVNVGLAAAAAAVLAVLVPFDGLGALAVGAVVLLVAMAVIYLRGYLVPGTPWLTRTYLPDWFLRYFDHADPAPAPADVEPQAVLEAAGAVVECEDIDDLCLTDGFRSAWHDRMERLRETDASRDDLAAILDIDPDALVFETHGEAFVAIADGGQRPDIGADGRRRVGQWESRGAFLADMAGAGVLGERYPGWDQLSPVQRGQVLNGLRIFLEQCPTCGGEVTVGEETVKSCCRSWEVVAVTCEACGERLFEARQPPEA